MPDLKTLVHELHRRSLWQVLCIYLAAAWAMLQFTAFVVDAVGLPRWITPSALIICAIGLPLVLATAFVQEGHPLRSRAEADPTLLPDLEDAQHTIIGVTEPPARPLRHWLTWRRALAGGALAFIVMATSAGGYMGMRVLGIGPVGTLRAAGVLTASDHVVLADFEAAEADAAMADVITEALRIDLMQSNALRLVDPADMQRVLVRMERERGTRVPAEVALEAARREAYKLVLAGEVARLGSGYVLTARLLHPETGATAAAFRQTASGDGELLHAVDELSRAIRTKIGESLRTVNTREPLEQVTTHSFEALQRFTTAERIVMGREPADGRVPVDLLREAVALDSTFAMAHRKLAALLGNAGLAAEAQEAARAAYRHRERLPEVERELAAGLYHWLVTYDARAAARAHQRVLELVPDQKSALNNITADHLRLGDAQRAAEAGRRGVRLPYPYLSQFNNLAMALVSLREYDEALALSEASFRHLPNNYYGWLIPIFVWTNRFDYARADSVANAMIAAAPVPSRLLYEALLARGAVRAITGRARAAAADFERVPADMPSLPLRHLLLETAVFRARLTVEVLGERVRGVEQLRAALRAYPVDSMAPQDVPALQLAGAFAAAGETADAEQWLEFDDRRRAPEAVQKEFGYEKARALLLMQSGRAQEALELLRRSPFQVTCPGCVAVQLARAHEQLGQRDSAVAQYRVYLETPWADRAADDMYYLASAHFRLGELLEQAGDAAGAARHYGAFVELWRDADAELRPQVEAARQRLAALRARG